MKVILTNTKGTYDISNYVINVSISGSYTQAARNVNIEILFSDNFEKFSLNLGDIIKITEDRDIFIGYVWTIDKSSDSSMVNVECYDKGIYLIKNSTSYKFTNTTPESIARKIASDYGIAIGSLATTNISISRNFLGDDLYSIIIGAYYQASIKNNKQYVVRFESNKLNVIEKGLDKSTILQSGNNILSSNASETLNNMVNSVAIYDKDDNLVTKVSTDNEIKLYGLMQEYYKISGDEDYTSKAKSKLKGVEKKVTVTNFGNVNCITGNTVIVHEPINNLYGLFYIDGDTHTWKNGIYTNKLTLNFKNIMDAKEVGDIPE